MPVVARMTRALPSATFPDMECPHCHYAFPAGSLYCGQCGAFLAETAPPAEAADDRAERRHLTVMFCDLVGSTGLSSSLDPEDFRELLRRYLDVADTVARRFSGFVGQVHGDGMLVYFGYPKSREDSAILAVRAGLGILRAIEDLNREITLAGRDPLHVRIGIHTGLLVVGELGTGQGRESSVVVGKTPNLAARVQALARPGTVVISGDTWRLVRPYFRCEPLGDFVLKGIAEPVGVFRVAAEILSPDAATDLTALVGRDSELRALVEAWRGVGAVGANFTIVGEAGIGKSRLVQEFIRAVAAEPPQRLVARGSAQAQSSAFFPLLEMLRQRIGCAVAEPAEEQFEKIEKFAAEFAFPVAETSSLLASVLSVEPPADRAIRPLSPAAARQRLIGWLPEFLQTLAARRALVFAVEDLHWLDPSSIEALNHLFAGGPIAGVLVLLTARPEFTAPWAPLPLIALERLHAREVADFAEKMAGGKELPGDIVHQVVAKANGVPLFVEEMMKMVLESGLLVECESHFETTAPLPSLAIPDTLHALLMARLDRTSTVREVAQIAAVLGSEFDYEMLRSLCPFDETLLAAELGRLVEAGLLSRSGVIPHATFAFRHALIQAEAYQSLLKRKRQRYHEEIAGMLAERFPEMLATQPELVAHHYTEGGRPAEAIGFWLRAATRSVERSANLEAIAQAASGLALLPALADDAARRERELLFLVMRGQAEVQLRGYAAPEVQQTYSRARELCREVGGSPQIYQVLALLNAFFTSRAEFAAAREMADEMLRVGEESDSSIFLENAWLALATDAFYVGRLDDAVDHATRSLECCRRFSETRPPRTLDIEVAALSWGGIALILRGQPDEGLAWARRGVAHAAAIAHPHSLAFARHFVQLAHYWREEPAGVLEGMETYLAECREQGFIYWIALGSMLGSWARVALGQSGMALEILRRALAGWQRTGARLAGSQNFGFLADACARLGEIDEGLSAIESGRAYPRETGEHCYEADLTLIEGRLRAATDAPSTEASFRQSLEESRALGARWCEVRAARDLTKLLHSQGRTDEARREFADLAKSFDEGAGTPVLIELRGLLAG